MPMPSIMAAGIVAHAGLTGRQAEQPVGIVPSDVLVPAGNPSRIENRIIVTAKLPAFIDGQRQTKNHLNERCHCMEDKVKSCPFHRISTLAGLLCLEQQPGTSKNRVTFTVQIHVCGGQSGLVWAGSPADLPLSRSAIDGDGDRVRVQSEPTERTQNRVRTKMLSGV